MNNIDLRIEPHPIKVTDFEKGKPFVQEIIDTEIKKGSIKYNNKRDKKC